MGWKNEPDRFGNSALLGVEFSPPGSNKTITSGDIYHAALWICIAASLAMSISALIISLRD